LKSGLETEGAVLIKLMGRRARPDEVYKTYRHRPIVVNNPRVNVSARSPSNNKSRFVKKQSTQRQYTCSMGSGTLTILGQQLLEIVQVLAISVLRDRDEETNEEQHNHDCHKAHGILKSAPEALPNGLFPRFGSDLVIFFVEEVGERNHEQTENGVQRVE